MKSKIESSFGARLRRAEDALKMISGWTHYDPPREEEQFTALTALVSDIRRANDDEAVKHTLYTTAAATRSGVFLNNADSLRKMLARLRGAVEAVFEKNGTIALQVASAIKKLRPSAAAILHADPAHPEEEKTMSQSQLSFGSLAKRFSDLVSNLEQSGGYSSTTPGLTLESLRAKAAELNTVSDDTAQKLSAVIVSRNTRGGLYRDLADRLNHLKAYARTFAGGRNSIEYTSLLKLKI